MIEGAPTLISKALDALRYIFGASLRIRIKALAKAPSDPGRIQVEIHFENRTRSPIEIQSIRVWWPEGCTLLEYQGQFPSAQVPVWKGRMVVPPATPLRGYGERVLRTGIRIPAGRFERAKFVICEARAWSVGWTFRRRKFPCAWVRRPKGIRRKLQALEAGE